MLSPRQFDTDDDLPRFTTPVENLRIGETDFGPVEVPTSYSADWSPLFHLDEFASSSQFSKSIEFLSDFPVLIQFTGTAEPVKLLVSKINFVGPNPSDVMLEAHSRFLPIAFGPLQIGSSFAAVVLSPPAFLGNILRLPVNQSDAFELVPFKTKGAKACLLRASGCFNRDRLFSQLGDLMDFLTFLKGSYAGIGNVEVFDEHAAPDFNMLGFSLNDDWYNGTTGKRAINWFDFEIQKNLPEVFIGFTKAMSDPTTRQALRQTIGYYRASTVVRASSVEMAIIAAHTALEAIVNYILEHQAGWSATLRSERSSPFADKASAAAAYCRFTGDALEHSPELMKLAKSRNNMNAFEVISFFRNKLVHQDAKVTPTGLQLHETWTVAMWLIEVFVFYLIGYRGQIIDRRVYTGWRGTTCEIPLTGS
jgi:hypothetical protein